ncbi:MULTISPECIES: hypothetical protein [unclassified Rhizobium]|uniref:hypothetical protein n=1 Tax=unclassified Rhizobium TaxID=2613769 RepID=UPI00161D97D9|nr:MULTISPECIES: hypothetical protein [unclassified Rhizobium]MBB3319714.1 hypothetical protein [Rhizobium sp. BK181]MBB3544810.1 hypothetical protein [Rhizobium sp. BK399]MCS3743479.1 hypothetical protein [Rhizobium sp. BK661]MCS4095521.1 hypothetical protein [Rhizobium sp. BK176]
MQRIAVILIGLSFLAGCTGAKDFSSPGLAPIPGSVIYGGQPRTKLTKSPPGSTFPHNFIDMYGQRVEETYMIQPDRSLKIVHREIRPIRFHDR